MAQETRALTIQRTALQVDASEAADFAGQLMKHAAAGGALFPKDMTQSQAVQMARLSLAYGLDPIAGELILYQGRPYVTIDGRVRKAQEHAAYDGIECVPATDAERKAFRCGEDEHLWVARVWRKDRRIPFTGFGRSAGKGDRNPVSQTYAQEMAQKRAKARALRDAFAMPLPTYEDDQPDRPQRPRVYAGSYEPAGAVIDGESRVIEPDGATGELPPSEGNDITGSQVTAIHTLVGILKWADSEYRDLLRQTFGVDSSLDLTEGQAAALTECLGGVLANAQEAGRKVQMSEVVQAMKESSPKGPEDDGDPSWQRSKQRDGDRLKAEQERYSLLMGRAIPLGIDLKPYETDAGMKLAALIRINDKLDVAIAAATGTAPEEIGLPF